VVSGMSGDVTFRYLLPVMLSRLNEGGPLWELQGCPLISSSRIWLAKHRLRIELRVQVDGDGVKCSTTTSTPRDSEPRAHSISGGPQNIRRPEKEYGFQI
jgi:hypothetical protein